MLLMSQLLIQTKKIVDSVLTCACVPHFEKGSSTTAEVIVSAIPSLCIASSKFSLKLNNGINRLDSLLS